MRKRKGPRRGGIHKGERRRSATDVTGEGTIFLARNRILIMPAPDSGRRSLRQRPSAASAFPFRPASRASTRADTEAFPGVRSSVSLQRGVLPRDVSQTLWTSSHCRRPLSKTPLSAWYACCLSPLRSTTRGWHVVKRRGKKRSGRKTTRYGENGYELLALKGWLSRHRSDGNLHVGID